MCKGPVVKGLCKALGSLFLKAVESQRRVLNKGVCERFP